MLYPMALLSTGPFHAPLSKYKKGRLLRPFALYVCTPTEHQVPQKTPCRHAPTLSMLGECPDTHIACYNMLDPKSSMLKNVLFSGSYQSYNERVIGLSKHCLS